VAILGMMAFAHRPSFTPHPRAHRAPHNRRPAGPTPLLPRSPAPIPAPIARHPMTSDLRLHPRARRRLEAIVAHRAWAPAYLLAGPVGSGVEGAAAYLAKAILCTGNSPPCGVCACCRQVAAGCHLDLARFAPAEARRTDGQEGPIEVIRRLIAHLALRPSVGQRRVVVLPGVDLLQPAAANALLKTLEEPPGAAVLILTVRNPSAVLATIASRCQVVHLPLLDEATLTARGANDHLAAADARLLARVATAQTGLASTLEPARLRGAWEECGAVWSLLAAGDPGALLAWVDTAVKGRDDDLDLWLAAFGLWLRDGLLLAAGRPAEALCFPELARRLPASRLPPSAFFEHGADLLLTAHRRLAANGQAKLVVGDLLLTLQRDLARGEGGGYHGPLTRVAVGRGG